MDPGSQLSGLFTLKGKWILVMEGTGCQPPYSLILCRYVNTLLKLIPPVLGLQEQLRQAVQNRDMETSHGICRIAVALGENHSR